MKISTPILGRFPHIFLLATSLALLMISVIFGFAMAGARMSNRTAGMWIEALDLSAPAFWASGTSMRHPLAAIAAVDLRHSPNLPAPPRPAVDVHVTPGFNPGETAP